MMGMCVRFRAWVHAVFCASCVCGVRFAVLLGHLRNLCNISDRGNLCNLSELSNLSHLWILLIPCNLRHICNL